MKNTTSFALIALIVAGTFLVGLSQTSHGATSADAGASVAESVQCPSATSNSRSDLAASVAAVDKMIVDGTPVSADAIQASYAVNEWLSTTELSMRRVPAPSADIEVLSTFVATSPACGGSL